MSVLFGGGQSSSNNIIPPASTNDTDSSGMNEGDYHSGTEGYSANTAYPDTYYGSGDWDVHDEGDFNR